MFVIKNLEEESESEDMEALSPKQRLILAGMKCNSLPKIAKVNVEQHQFSSLSPSPACSDTGAAAHRFLPATETPSYESAEGELCC